MLPTSFYPKLRLVTFITTFVLVLSCVSAHGKHSATGKITGSKDMLNASLNVAVSTVQASVGRIEGLLKQTDLAPRTRVALGDCLEMIDELLSEIDTVSLKMEWYQPEKGAMSEEASHDLKILLSGAMTNQRACMAGLSEEAVVIRDAAVGGSDKVLSMLSDSLAMIKHMVNMNDSNKDGEKMIGNRRLLQVAKTAREGEFPSWMSAVDRKLMQATNVGANVVVAADGSGNYKTISAAVNGAPNGSQKRYIIQIKAGTYWENVVIPRGKTNLMFVGAGQGATVITGSRSNGGGSTTFSSATVAITGDRFLARDITFQNTAGPSGSQAVALRVGSDYSAFYRCEISGYQDTLYALELRQFYRDCTISGTVDFIFGNAAAVFQSCNINVRKPSQGQSNAVTAQSRSDPNQNTGFVILDSRIDGTSDLIGAGGSVETYLGRPWKAYSRVVIMKTYLGSIINPAGWTQWVGNEGLSTLYYAEYMNTGAGASTQNRVKWAGYKGVISAGEASKFTAGNFIQGSNWLGSTGFPYSLGV